MLRIPSSSSPIGFRDSTLSALEMAKIFAKPAFLFFLQTRFVRTSVASLPKTPRSLPSSAASLVDCLVKSLGIPQESAVSIARKLLSRGRSIEQPDSVLRFLKSCGFSEAQIVKILSRGPWLPLSDVESILKPKMEFFREIGLSDTLLLEVIARNPVLLLRSLDSYLKPQSAFLKKCLGSTNAFNTAIKRSPWLLNTDRDSFLAPNIDLLIKEGMSLDSISWLLKWHPRSFLVKSDKMASLIDRVKRTGIEPPSNNFARGLKVMMSLKELTWNKKVESFRNLGWSQEDILSTFRNFPFCFSLSEKKIKMKMDFYVNTALISPEFVVKTPLLLNYSMERRILPRWNVIATLLSQGLLKQGKEFVRLFVVPEKIFLERCVTKYMGEVPCLMELYRSSMTVTAKKK